MKNPEILNQYRKQVRIVAESNGMVREETNGKCFGGFKSWPQAESQSNPGNCIWDSIFLLRSVQNG